MKKYKVIWYEGYMDLDPKVQEKILKTIDVEADSIDNVNFIQILPEEEKEKFTTNIKYCVKTSWHSNELKDAKECVSDYGSHSKFIYVVEIE